MRRPYLWLILGVLFFVFFIGLPVSIGIITESMWFDSLGFVSVYWTSFLAKLVVFAAFALATGVILAGNIVLSRRLRPLRIPIVSPMQVTGMPALRYVIWAAAGFIALITGMVMVEQWSTILRFFNATSFGKVDPVFGQDISFYVFALPFWDMLRGWLLAVLILSIALSALSYVAGAVPGSTFEKFEVPLGLKAHVAGLGAALMLAIASGFWLANYQLLFSTRGVTRGASYADMNAQYIGQWIMVAVSLLVAGAFLANMRLRGWRFVVIPIAAWVGVAIVAVGIYPAIVQSLVVRPSELALEQPYIRNGIEGTRDAFNLNTIEERSYETAGELTYADVADNPQTTKNIRLLDYRPLQSTYSQIQEIRTYYSFTDIDIDRYMIDGNYRQVMLAARQLLTERLPAQAQTWVNQHIKYTHGYGLALSPVNEVTPEGLPRLLVKDIPPVVSSNDLKIDRPEIYYGTEPAPYVFVKTSTPEFDYPKGDDNVYSNYQGTGGVPAGGLLSRLAFSLRFGDGNILLSEYLTGESRIMFHRQIQDAATTIAPFLRYDKDPYLVVVQGKLYWIQDAYTVTADYPYSELYGGDIGYIRNSVKVVVDAYNGAMTFYIADATDPLVGTYRKIFPSLFQPMDQMPAEIRSHVRYPEDLLNIQAAMYSTYHMKDAQVFYNREDVWTLPQETFGDQVQPMQAYYVIMRAPGSQKEDFQLILPFTPSGRDNLIGWISAKSDGADYGKLLVFKFSKQELAYGPLQIEARINQHPTISQQLTLWGQRGSNVIRGNLLVIPIGKSLLYIQPLYLQAENGKIPELQRVIVATGNNVVMASTLDEALTQVFGQAPPAAQQPAQGGEQPPAVDQTTQELAKSAQDHYNKAQEYLKQGDWANYGKELDAMKADLDKLVQETQK